MALSAQIGLETGGVIAWVVVGLAAGLLAGRVIRGRGYGTAGDLTIGLVGTVAGGFLFGMLVTGTDGLVGGSIAVAFVAACLLIWAVRAVASGRAYA